MSRHYIIGSIDLDKRILINEEIVCNISLNDLKKLLLGKVLKNCDWIPTREVVTIY